MSGKSGDCSETSGKSPFTIVSGKQTIDIEDLLKKTTRIQSRIYINNHNDRSRDHFISNTNRRNTKNLQSQSRQPIVIKRNKTTLEKLQSFRAKLYELSEIVDLEINKTEVEWLSLTYHADKLNNTEKQQYTNDEQEKMKKITIDEIDEQLRNYSELPDLDLRPTITNIKQQINDDNEEFDTDTD